MKNIIKLIPILLFAFLFAGCDKIEDPYIIISEEEQVSVDFPALDENSVYRKILFEEYTGHRCQNCPTGHRKIEELHGIYGDTLVPICIHATTLSSPTDEFPNDFRTDVGNTLAEEFVIDGIPAGIINRAMEEGGWGVNRWQSKIQQVDRSVPLAAVQLINQYDGSKLKANVQVTMLSDNENPLYLALYVIEDGVVSRQIDGSTTIEDYVHNHVLRGSMNGVYGIQLNNGQPLQDRQTCQYAKSIDLAGCNWNVANCSVVAILYDKKGGQVLQVETAPFVSLTR